MVTDLDRSNATHRQPRRRQSIRAAATRHALLAGAQVAFTEAGYAEASIADVVARSNASVGSLYHHFDGKADLFLALFEAFNRIQTERATAGVTAARGHGVSDPMALFLAGTQAYLCSCWEHRDLARLFLAGGGPDGFDEVVRRRTQDWVAHNSSLLHAEQRPNGEALVHTLTTVAATAGREVARCACAEQARKLTQDFLVLITRLAAPEG
ncbi:MAG: TetR/AcrR family transcriptional regulator [Geodermatophilaceae bacterium]